MNESEESQFELSQEEDDVADEAENAEEEQEIDEDEEEDEADVEGRDLEDVDDDDGLGGDEQVEQLPPHEGKTIVIHQLVLNPPQRRFLAPAIVKVSAKPQTELVESAAASRVDAFAEAAKLT